MTAHFAQRVRAVRCLLVAIGVGIPAQAVHLVAPGSALPEIGSALAIAAPGDVIHVMPGTYAPFAVGIGCTIRALAPGVLVQPGVTSASVAISAPAGQTVHLVALGFSFPNGGNVVVNNGRVTLDACTIAGVGSISSGNAPLVITNADVHLQGCTVTCTNQFGFSPAVQATAARMTAIDSGFFGSPPAPSFFYVVSPAISATSMTLHAAGCTIQAGVYGTGQVPGLSVGAGEVWLSDCTVVGYGACPIQGAASVLADRCSLQPAGAPCPTPASGGLLGVTRPQPLQNGAPFSLTYRTIPNSYAAVFASQELATLTIPGLHAQTQWLGGGIFNLGVVLADASGQATGTWSIPAGAWLVDQPLWFQGLTGFALPLQLSPVAGGVIR